jgi:hypothetical protein
VPDRRRTDPPIAEAIDDVARGLTAVEAPPLRAAVLARLGRQTPSTVGLGPPALVAVAATIVALVVHWPRPEIARGVERLAAVSTAEATPVTQGVPPRAVTPGRQPARAAAVDEAGAALPTVPALSPIEGLAVASIQPDALAVPQLTVQPLMTAAPLIVPALDDIYRDR